MHNRSQSRSALAHQLSNLCGTVSRNSGAKGAPPKHRIQRLLLFCSAFDCSASRTYVAAATTSEAKDAVAVPAVVESVCLNEGDCLKQGILQAIRGRYDQTRHETMLEPIVSLQFNCI